MSDYDPDDATAREDLCRFLSACYCEPTEEFAQESLFDSILVATARIDPELANLARNLEQAFAAQDIQTLLVDYTRLFLGPTEALASPYGTTWLNAPVETEDNPPPAVVGLYDEGGFEVEESFGDLPDHVAVELEFLYLLTFNQNQAEAADQPKELAAAQALRQRFLREHLGAWMDPFAAAIQTNAETAFYRELARLTQRFVRIESDALLLH